VGRYCPSLPGWKNWMTTQRRQKLNT